MQIKKQNCKKDYLHKITKYIVDYCLKEKINQVIIGDISRILKNTNLGKIVNQQLFQMPYAIIYHMLYYKLASKGISLIKQNESYTSQCSPLSVKVSRKYANKANRIMRGLFCDSKSVWNADSVGAYNILRLNKDFTQMPKATGLSNPTVIKIAV